MTLKLLLVGALFSALVGCMSLEEIKSKEPSQVATFADVGAEALFACVHLGGPHDTRGYDPVRGGWFIVSEPSPTTGGYAYSFAFKDVADGARVEIRWHTLSGFAPALSLSVLNEVERCRIALRKTTQTRSGK